jgi:hypothetical protein
LRDPRLALGCLGGAFVLGLSFSVRDLLLWSEPGMELYQFSENSTIERFRPRPPLARPEVAPLVSAIAAWHAPMSFTPRDCPGVCGWPLSRSIVGAPASVARQPSRRRSSTPARSSA